MSVIRPRPPEEPLEHAVCGRTAGADDGPLSAAHGELLASPGGLDLAAGMLAEYDADRPASRLFAVLSVARRLREAVDRLVCTGSGAIGPATRLLAVACCHPFHDQLPRGERGGRPRLAWADAAAGDDDVQGLLDLVAPFGHARGEDLLERWAILAVEPAAPDQRLLATLRLLVAALPEGPSLADRLVVIARPGGSLGPLAERRGATVLVEPAAASPAGMFTAAGLLPAAVAGVDVVRLLRGAAAMLRRFAEAPPHDNPVLQDAAAARALVGSSAVAGGRPFAGPAAFSAAVAGWHRQLRRGGPATRLAVGDQRCDRLRVPAVPDWPDGLDPLVDSFRDELPPEPDEPGAGAALPAVTIRLPRIDEHALGQLVQLLLLSAAVEDRLAAPV